MRFVSALCLAGALLTTSAFGDAPPLPAGWSEIVPGGDTLCARGKPYSFFVRHGASDKVIIDFIGGGACWNTDTCDTGNATFDDSVDSLRSRVQNGGLHGVYDVTNAANPYKDWTHVVVPYCTGDVHWGSADVTYTRPDASTFVIHHRGATNAQAVLDWTKQNFAKPDQVLVTGCSAGSYGSIFHTPRVREMFPAAHMQQFGDSGVGILTTEWQKTSFPLWKITAAAPSWVPGLDPATTDYTTISLTDFYERAASHYPDVRFAQYSNAFDFVQTFFYIKMGGVQDDWSPNMFKALAKLDSDVPNFRSYIGPNDHHCVTTEDEFYTVTSSNVKVSDWLTGYVNGAATGNVTCKPNCGAPTNGQ